MAIKNTKFGGTDWVDGEILLADDLNDTFDATAGPGWNLNLGPGSFLCTNFMYSSIAHNGSTFSMLADSMLGSTNWTPNSGSVWYPVGFGTANTVEILLPCSADTEIAVAMECIENATCITVNGGSTWDFKTYADNADMVDLTFPTATRFACTEAPTGTVYTADVEVGTGSMTWVQSCADPDTSRALSFFDDDVGYLLAQDGDIWKTDDGGANFADTTDNILETTTVYDTCFALTADIVFFGHVNGVDRYVNSTNTVERVIFQRDSLDLNMGFCKTDDGTIYTGRCNVANAATPTNAILYRSTNNGLSWSSHMLAPGYPTAYAQKDELASLKHMINQCGANGIIIKLPGTESIVIKSL